VESYEQKLKKYIRVFTNDPLNKYIKLTLLADIEIEFNILPPHINFGRVAMSENVRDRHVQMVGTKVSSIKIKKIEPMSPFLGTQYLPANSEHPAPRIAISLKKGLPAGSFTSHVLLSTDYKTVPEIRIAVTAIIIHNIKIDLKDLIFRISPSDPHPQEIITLRNPYKKNFKIIKSEIVTDPTQTNYRNLRSISKK